jgi:hypothetical protein
MDGQRHREYASRVREEEFEALCSWGEALVRDPRPEVAAAGRAIQLLAAEVDRLEMEVWNLRLGVADPGAPAADTSQVSRLGLDEELQRRLKRGRLRRLLGSTSRHLPLR